VTNGINCDDSETVAMELSNKLTGDACKLFFSTPSHLYYVRGCRGIEMFHLLQQKFKLLDNDSSVMEDTALHALNINDVPNAKQKKKNGNVLLKGLMKKI
jgi:hypothetical protein